MANPPELGGTARRKDPAPGKSVTGSQAGDVVLTQASKAKKTTGGGKPSVTGHAAKGAAKGAEAGAAVGSVVPVVGNAVGAAAGAVVGGAGGAIGGRKAKNEWLAAKRAARGGGTQLLIAEFVVCMIVLALSPLQADGKDIAAKDWMKRGTAVCALFMVLGMVGSVGPKTTRAMAAFGGLVTLGLLVNQRSIFVTIADRLKSTGSATDAGPPTADDQLGDAVGQAITDFGVGQTLGGGIGGLGGATGAGMIR